MTELLIQKERNHCSFFLCRSHYSRSLCFRLDSRELSLRSAQNLQTRSAGPIVLISRLSTSHSRKIKVFLYQWERNQKLPSAEIVRPNSNSICILVLLTVRFGELPANTGNPALPVNSNHYFMLRIGNLPPSTTTIYQGYL